MISQVWKNFIFDLFMVIPAWIGMYLSGERHVAMYVVGLASVWTVVILFYGGSWLLLRKVRS